jgi:hypothetical protein
VSNVGTGLAALAAVGPLAVVAPAAAKPTHPTRPSHPTQPSQPPTSRKCAGHNVAYVASGQFVSWTATQNADRTWSGTITLHVTRSNRHADAARAAT